MAASGFGSSSAAVVYGNFKINVRVVDFLRVQLSPDRGLVSG
jgi:hypothetical protein